MLAARGSTDFALVDLQVAFRRAAPSEPRSAQDYRIASGKQLYAASACSSRLQRSPTLTACAHRTELGWQLSLGRGLVRSPYVSAIWLSVCRFAQAYMPASRRLGRAVLGCAHVRIPWAYPGRGVPGGTWPVLQLYLSSSCRCCNFTYPQFACIPPTGPPPPQHPPSPLAGGECVHGWSRACMRVHPVTRLAARCDAMCGRKQLVDSSWLACMPTRYAQVVVCWTGPTCGGCSLPLCALHMEIE